MALLQKTLNLDFQAGRKTYILAVIYAIYTVLSYFYGDLSLAQTTNQLFGSGVVMTIRKALKGN